MEIGKKLPPEFKKKWLDALRSGEYDQSKECLKTKSGFCCLGVACDLVGVKGKVWEEDSTGGYFTYNGYSSDYPRRGDLPDDVMDCLKSEYKTYTNPKGNVMAHVAEMNDNGRSFKEIADWIEENL